jgi:hypothetical protein
MTTNETLDMHRPTAEFRDFLEDEVIREYRRRRTFRRLRAAAVIIVSAGIGMSATLASAQVRTNNQRDSLKAALAGEAAITTARFMIAKAQLAEEQRQVAAGVRPSSSLGEADLQLRIAEEAVAHVALNGREIEASGLPPRDDLNAPLVKGEDFVKQRIENRMMTANRRLQAAEQSLTDIDRRVAVGAATEPEAFDARLAVFRARADLAGLAARMDARKEFISKGTAVEMLAGRVERTEAEQAVGVAQMAVQTARARLALVEKRKQVGAATEADVLRARLEVLERDVDYQLAIQRVNRVK